MLSGLTSSVLYEVEQLQLFLPWKHIGRLNALKQCEQGEGNVPSHTTDREKIKERQELL
jgi:hypothetical protein